MGKCKFNEGWLRNKDKNGHYVSEWAKKDGESDMFCCVCMKKFSISWGYEAVERHASTQKHKEQCKVKLATSQLHLESVRPNDDQSSLPSTSSNKMGSKTVQIYSVKDGATRTEILWTMKMVASNYSIEPSCNAIKELFMAMFPGSVPSDFSMSTTKARYLICDALAPYFKKELLNDCSNSYFSLCFDETSNAASKKELQVAIKYWSPTKDLIVTSHLETFLIGKATAQDIVSKLNEAMDNAQLSRKKLLMLGCDGPNVNKAVTKLMNESLSLLGRQKLVDIGTCNIHTVHNAFLKALVEFGENVSEFIFQVHNFFDGWPARWEEYEIIQEKLKLPSHRFLKHVSSRWLTLGAAVERVLEQWPAIIEYFIKYLPKKSQKTTSQNYKNIYNFLIQKSAKIEVMFVASSAQIFVKFTGLFQREEPLIHIMYDELKKLVKTILNIICKSDAPTSISALEDKYYLPIQEIVTEDSIAKLLQLHLQERERLTFLTKVRNHYAAACKHLLSKTSIDNSLAKSLRVVNPNISKTEMSYKDFLKIAKSLPIELDESALINECRLISHLPHCDNSDKKRIETYWVDIFKTTFDTGEKMYPNLEKLVKAALTLCHGNADVERGFSRSGHILTTERAKMSQRTLNAHLTVKSVLTNMYNNRVDFVPLTKELMNLARTAYMRYRQYCEDQKKIEEEKKMHLKEKEEADNYKKELKRKFEESKDSIKEGESTLKKLKEEEKVKRLTVDRLINSASEILKDGIKDKDLVSVNMAKSLLDVVVKERKEEEKKIEEEQKIQSIVDKKKNSLITNFFKKA